MYRTNPMRKIFGVACAIALSIIPNPVLSEDMPPMPIPDWGSSEDMPPIPNPDPRNEEERNRELKEELEEMRRNEEERSREWKEELEERRRKAEERRRKAEERRRKEEERRRKAEERRRALEGDHGFVDTEVSQVLVQGTSDRFDRSLCKLTNGAFVLCELTAEVGLPAMDISPLKLADRITPFDATDVVGLVKARKGFGAIIKQGENFTLQRFRSWNSAKTYIAMSKTDDITKKICDFETVENQDFNGDQLIGVAIEGDQLIGVKIKVLKTIFPGNDKFDRGLYEIKASKASGCEIEETNGLVISEMGLQPGDTILENDAISLLDRRRELYPSSDVIGVVPIKNGIALLVYEYGKFRAKNFRKHPSSTYFRETGKSRRPEKLFCHYEEVMDYDFNGNQIIGCN